MGRESSGGVLLGVFFDGYGLVGSACRLADLEFVEFLSDVDFLDGLEVVGKASGAEVGNADLSNRDVDDVVEASDVTTEEEVAVETV